MFKEQLSNHRNSKTHFEHPFNQGESSQNSQGLNGQSNPLQSYQSGNQQSRLGGSQNRQFNGQDRQRGGQENQTRGFGGKSQNGRQNSFGGGNLNGRQNQEVGDDYGAPSQQVEIKVNCQFLIYLTLNFEATLQFESLEFSIGLALQIKI